MRCLLELRPGHLWVILFGAPLAIMMAWSSELVSLEEIRGVQTGWLILFHLWIWSVGSRAQDDLPRPERLGVGLFWVTVFLSLVLSLAINYRPAPMVALFNSRPAAMWGYWAIFLAIDLYAQIFVARVIVRAEVRKGQPESGVVLTVLLFWILPLGILPLQRRCNALAGGANSSSSV